MGKIGLKEYIPSEHIHTFLFEHDVTLTMRDMKPNRYGDYRAKVEACHGETCACAGTVTLWDSESSMKFSTDASARVSDIDWFEVLRIATETIEQHLKSINEDNQKAEWRPEVVTMSDIEEEDIEWLWWPYISFGKVCMLDSDPGIGKSLFTVQLASTLSVGELLPDQQGKPTIHVGSPSDTLMLALEDGLADTLKKRIRLCGGDDKRIHVMKGWRDSDDELHPFTLQGMPKLEAAMQQYKPRLVVIDPIQSYLGKINMNQANEVHPLMNALAAVAEKYRCAIITIRHPSKPGQGVSKVIHRGIGSVAFIGGVRTGLFVEQHPRDKNRVLLCQGKSNIGFKGRTQIFSKEEGKFLWAGVTRLDAEMLGGSGRGPDPYAFIGATCWLEEKMKPGIPESSKAIEEQMYEDGYSKDTIKRVKQAFGIKSTKAGNGWMWTLPPLHSISTPITTTTTSTTSATTTTSATCTTSMESSSYKYTDQEAKDGQEVQKAEEAEEVAVVIPPLNDIDRDVSELFGVVDVTPIDDEPPEDMLNVPTDATADVSPKRHAAQLTRRAKKMADIIRPTANISPIISPVDDEQPPPDDAYADFIGEQVDNTEKFEEDSI